MSTTKKKILLPLATLVAAGAIAIGSGATFTSSSGNTASVTSGTLQQTNSKDGAAIFDLDDIKPGDTVNGSLTLTNTGSLPAKFSLTEKTSTNGFSGEYLKLTITDTTNGTEVYRGTFGGLEDGKKNALGVFAAGDARSYTFSVHLDQTAPNSQQGKAAGAEYTWDSVQLDGETTNR